MQTKLYGQRWTNDWINARKRGLGSLQWATKLAENLRASCGNLGANDTSFFPGKNANKTSEWNRNYGNISTINEDLSCTCSQSLTSVFFCKCIALGESIAGFCWGAKSTWLFKGLTRPAQLDIWMKRKSSQVIRLHLIFMPKHGNATLFTWCAFLGTRMSRWKLGSMVSKWVITLIYPIYK